MSFNKIHLQTNLVLGYLGQELKTTLFLFSGNGFFTKLAATSQIQLAAKKVSHYTSALLQFVIKCEIIDKSTQSSTLLLISTSEIELTFVPDSYRIVLFRFGCFTSESFVTSRSYCSNPLEEVGAICIYDGSSTTLTVLSCLTARRTKEKNKNIKNHKKPPNSCPSLIYV